MHLFPLDRAEEFLRQQFPDLERRGSTLTWSDHQGRTELKAEPVQYTSHIGGTISELVTLSHASPQLAAVSVDEIVLLNRFATLSSLVIADAANPTRMVAKVGIFAADRAAAERVYAPLLCTEAAIIGWHADRIATHQFSATAEACPLDQTAAPAFHEDIPRCLNIAEALGYAASPGKAGFVVEFPWDPGAVSHMFRVPLPDRQDNLSQEDIERLGGNTALMTASTDTPHSLYGGGLLVGLQVPLNLDGQDAALFVNAMNRWEMLGAELRGLELPPLFGSWCIGPQGPTFVTFIPNHLGAQIPGVLQNVMIWNQQRTIWLRQRLDALNSAIPPDQIRAYALTDFRVLTEEPFTLRIGQRCVQLRELHDAHQTDCSAFVTACNPGSELLSEARNAERHAALMSELAARGLSFIEGVGNDSSNKWPGERSVLVFGILPEDTKRLGRQFDQNAIVWSGADVIPRLILLR